MRYEARQCEQGCTNVATRRLTYEEPEAGYTKVEHLICEECWRRDGQIGFVEQVENLVIYQIKPCAFNMKEAGFITVCENQGTECGWCACSGPCDHEMNPVCERHAGFLEGWVHAQPEDPEDEEGLDIVHEAAAKFIRITYTER